VNREKSDGGSAQSADPECSLSENAVKDEMNALIDPSFSTQSDPIVVSRLKELTEAVLSIREMTSCHIPTIPAQINE
jgi:hypothetical protein